MKESRFLTFTEKVRLTKNIEDGNKDSIRILIDELDRLESLVKDYEIIMRQAYDRARSDYNKTPKNY